MSYVFDEGEGSSDFPLGPLGSAIARDGGRPLSVDPSGLGVMVMGVDERDPFSVEADAMAKRSLVKPIALAFLVAAIIGALAFFVQAKLQAENVASTSEPKWHQQREIETESLPVVEPADEGTLSTTAARNNKSAKVRRPVPAAVKNGVTRPRGAVARNQKHHPSRQSPAHGYTGVHSQVAAGSAAELVPVQ